MREHFRRILNPEVRQNPKAPQKPKKNTAGKNMIGEFLPNRQFRRKGAEARAKLNVQKFSRKAIQNKIAAEPE